VEDILVVMKSQPVSYPDHAREISSALAPLRRSQPGVMHGFHHLSQAALEDGTVSAKTKELMALALGVAAHCDGCIAFHAKALVALGASRPEVEETLAVAVYMGGGPSLMYAADALTAFDQFQQLATETA
jgi:AhpD family alkylhydroperoxidase